MQQARLVARIGARLRIAVRGALALLLLRRALIGLGAALHGGVPGATSFLRRARGRLLVFVRQLFLLLCELPLLVVGLRGLDGLGLRLRLRLAERKTDLANPVELVGRGLVGLVARFLEELRPVG